MQVLQFYMGSILEVDCTLHEQKDYGSIVAQWLAQPPHRKTWQRTFLSGVCMFLSVCGLGFLLGTLVSSTNMLVRLVHCDGMLIITAAQD